MFALLAPNFCQFIVAIWDAIRLGKSAGEKSEQTRTAPLAVLPTGAGGTTALPNFMK
jgi:hypothetical protein